MDFLKKTNPWGSSAEDEEARKLAEQTPNPAFAAQQLMAFVQGRQQHAARHRKKK